MVDSITKKYKVSGSGFLTIDGDIITISVDGKGDYNLANILGDLNERPVKFNFSYDEDYEEEEEYLVADPETGEVI